MTKSTITDERITSVIERLEHFASNLKWTDVRGAQDLLTAADGLRELQERRKADSEPVAWTDTEELRDVNVDGIGYLFGIDREANKFADPRRQIMLYRHAQPAPERDQVRSEHAEWSQATFGNVGPIGPLKHLSKEALKQLPNLTTLANGRICNSCYGMRNAVPVSLTSRLHRL